MRQPLGEYDDHTYDEYELVGEPRSDDHVRPDRRLPTILLCVVTMALFAGGLWFAYHEGTRHPSGSSLVDGGIPTIHADQRPDKVKPDQAGGMQIPDQNVSLYNEKPGGAPVEKLLPPPEKPMPRPAPEPPQAAAPPTPPPSPPVGAPAQPAPSASAATTAATVPPPGVPAPVVLTPVRPSIPAKLAPPAPTTTAAATTAAATTGAGPVQIRLASVRSPDVARAEWQRIKRDHADLLGRLNGFAVRADLGDKGIYYRIEAGPIDSVAAADRLCGELKKRGLGCILAR